MGHCSSSVSMLRRPALILLLLVVSTLIGVGLTLYWPQGRVTWVFWACTQFLPLLYVFLAWLGCDARADDEAEQ
jgi:hypothetical protein